MLTIGIIVLVVSVIVERTVQIRTLQLTDAAGGDGLSGDMRYHWEGGAPRWMSIFALVFYLGIVVGIALILVAVL